MMFSPIKRARLTYAIVMSICMCVVMSAVSTSVLRPIEAFWQSWPHVLLIDLCVAIPVAIMLGPVVRKLCSRLYPGVAK